MDLLFNTLEPQIKKTEELIVFPSPNSMGGGGVWSLFSWGECVAYQ